MHAFANALWAPFRSLFDWWARELFSLFPSSVRAVFSSDPDKLTLYYDDGGLRVVRRAERRAHVASEGAVSREVDSVALSPLFADVFEHPPPGDAIVWLPYSACLERSFTVPAAAAADLERVVQLELERATPFRVQDVYSSYIADPSPENRAILSVRHFIIKLETISALQDKLKEAGVEAGTITCLDKTNQKPLPINFLAHRESVHARRAGGIPALAAVLLLLIATATAVAMFRSERALSELEAQANKARSEWQERESSAKPAIARRDEATAIAALTSKRVATVLVLNEVTRCLPDDVHLSDFRVADGTVVIGGLGRDTSRLIPLLADSELFTRVELAAPVTIDPATDKERFSIRFALRSDNPPADEPTLEAPL